MTDLEHSQLVAQFDKAIAQRNADFGAHVSAYIVWRIRNLPETLANAAV